MTEVLQEKKRAAGKKTKVVLTWAPHVKPLPQCVANSFAQWINQWGQAEFVITYPEEYELDGQFTKGANITHDQDAALEGADFIYVKNWSTYADYGRVYCNDPDWMLTRAKMERTNAAKVMHCLPVRRNVAVAEAVLDGPRSVVLQEAHNRLVVQMAVLHRLLA